MRTIITPRDKQHWLELRAPNLNSTEIPALFGCSPYMTKFELWHQKRAVHLAMKSGEKIPINEIEINDRMFIGSGLEEAIGKMAASRLKIQVHPLKDYIHIPENNVGSSFDFMFSSDGAADGIMEIKNVDYIQYKTKWIEHSEEDIEAPLHIELQVQTQLLVSGLSSAYLCALVGGNDLKIIHRKADEELHKVILDRAQEFWASIERNNPPPIDFEKDAEFVISLNQYAEPGKLLDLEAIENADAPPSELPDTVLIRSLALQYATAQKAESASKKEKEKLKAQIMTMIGDAEKVIHPEFSISAGVIGPVQIAAHERAGYRNFKVYKKGEA